MLRDLSDAWAWITRLMRRVDRLESGSPLENASITKGRVRFIGGLLRLDSGARLEGVGTFEWSGAGSIAGNWEVLQGGVIKVGGVLISPVGGGRIMIGEGPVGILLDGGTGTMTMGNIRLEGGKIYVGVGGSQIVIDGATGKLTAGNVTIEPDRIIVGSGSTAATLQNGELSLSSGAKLAVGLTGGASSIGLLPGGSADVSANTLTAWLRATGSTISVTTAQASITAPSIFMANLPTGAPAGAKAVLVDPSNGKLYRAA